MRAKAYETFIIPALTKNAAEARGFRNQLRSNITKLAKGDEAPVFKWIDKRYREDDVSKLKDSGSYPLLDLLGHRLLEQAKGSRFSMDFQSQKKGCRPKGGYSCGMFLRSTNSIATEAPV